MDWRALLPWSDLRFRKQAQGQPGELEILGDGSQKKSYLHVEDGIRGIFLALEKMTIPKNVINLGHAEYMNVKDLAESFAKNSV